MPLYNGQSYRLIQHTLHPKAPTLYSDNGDIGLGTFQVTSAKVQLPGEPAGFFAGRRGCNLWLIAPTFLLQCMHIKEKNWCSPNPSVENNLASSLFSCNKTVNQLRPSAFSRCVFLTIERRCCACETSLYSYDVRCGSFWYAAVVSRGLHACKL